MTALFTSFKKRIDEIGLSLGSLLDPDPATHTDTKSQDIIKSYILLCHSEFEFYFEQIVKSVLDEGMLRANKGRIKKSYLSSIKAQNKEANVIIDKNNGIKFESLKRILGLAGFDASKISGETYVTKLNEFAKKRGGFAHKGQTGLSTLLCFSQEKSAIIWLLDETERLVDKYFGKNFNL